jgi:tetratricopeptide (TPR) repeat protein
MKIVTITLTLFLLLLGPCSLPPDVYADGSSSLPISGATLSWAKQPWTGKDAPFSSIRSHIDEWVASGELSASLIGAYQRTAEQNPTNALDQFQWAYAIYATNLQTGGHLTDRSIYTPFYHAMLVANNPHCYDYDRLLLLLASGYPEELPLVERLLKVNPNDIPVERAYAHSLVEIRGNDNNARAVTVAESAAASDNYSAQSLYQLAYIYLSVASKQKDPVYWTKAASTYQRFLDAVPFSDSRRSLVLRLIAYAQSHEKSG